MLCAHCVNSSAEFTPFRIHSIYLGRRVVQCEEWKSKRDSFIHIQLYVPRAIRPTQRKQTLDPDQPERHIHTQLHVWEESVAMRS